MWYYEQRSGAIARGRGQTDVVAVGYSGNGPAKNDPASQTVVGHGPLPQGLYRILAPSDTPTHGPYVLALVPAPANEMFGRSGFLIHGDSVEHPGNASDGCIILPRVAREWIWESGDHELQVWAR